jgi:hypothetical protein
LAQDQFDQFIFERALTLRTVGSAHEELLAIRGCPACKNGKPEPKKAKKKSKVNKK